MQPVIVLHDGADAIGEHREHFLDDFFVLQQAVFGECIFVSPPMPCHEADDKAGGQSCETPRQSRKPMACKKEGERSPCTLRLLTPALSSFSEEREKRSDAARELRPEILCSLRRLGRFQYFVQFRIIHNECRS